MHTDRQLVPDIAARLGVPLLEPNWAGIDAALPILEKMKSEGAVVVLKIDGERGPDDNGAYTAIVSGSPLGEDFLRVDADTLEDALAYVVVRYAARKWKYARPSSATHNKNTSHPPHPKATQEDANIL